MTSVQHVEPIARTRQQRQQVPLAVMIPLLALVFGLLVTANSAGYRFGISDQAFYIPAIDLAQSPDLFPRARVLIEGQARLTLVDEAIGWICRVTGLALEPVFFAAYLGTIALFAVGIALVGRVLFRSTWAIAILAIGLSLRHRIPETAANTFEGYFHPRLLAFAVGLVAIGLFLHRARRAAVVLAACAVAVHPTTGGWFLVWIGVAAWVGASARARWLAGTAGAIAVPAMALAAREELVARLAIMDPAWTAAFGSRDYVFPTSSWNLGTWLALLATPAIILAVSAWRRRTGERSPSEHAIAIGALSLFGLFLLSLPFIAARVALVVQLQTSRVFWPMEFLATAYVAWVLAEAPWRTGSTRVRTRVVLAVLIVAAVARGVYVLRIEHDNPLVAVRPQETDWHRLGRWIAASTPRSAHFLVHPEHVFRYGSSFRVVAKRDVLVEAVKDRAVAMYSREGALRLQERLRAAGELDVVDERRFAALADRYDLDYLVTERRLNLPMVHREGRLRLYSAGLSAPLRGPTTPFSPRNRRRDR